MVETFLLELSLGLEPLTYRFKFVVKNLPLPWQVFLAGQLHPTTIQHDVAVCSLSVTLIT